MYKLMIAQIVLVVIAVLSMFNAIAAFTYANTNVSFYVLVSACIALACVLQAIVFELSIQDKRLKLSRNDKFTYHYRVFY
jgi:hypothetical protein